MWENSDLKQEQHYQDAYNRSYNRSCLICIAIFLFEFLGTFNSDTESTINNWDYANGFNGTKNRSYQTNLIE